MLTVMHCVTKMDRAGAETFLMNLFCKIDRNELKFNFLCFDASEGAYDEEIRELGGELYKMKPEVLQGRFKQIKKYAELYKMLREHPCDVFHIHTDHAMDAFFNAFVAKLCKIKIVAVHSHNAYNAHHVFVHRIFKQLLKFLRICRFACSDKAGKWLFGSEEFSVLCNGVDLDNYYYQDSVRKEVRKELSMEGKKVIGHVGRFNMQKNHVFLLEIFEKMYKIDSATHLILVGKGELEEEIRNAVRQKGLTDAVTFLGIRNDLHRIYQAMDLFLFPSLFEGLPVVLIEAQATDLPCVVSSNITREVFLTSKSAVLSLEHSADEWANETLKMLNTAEERKDNRMLIRNAGYDISYLAHMLPQYYMTSSRS